MLHYYAIVFKKKKKGTLTRHRIFNPITSVKFIESNGSANEQDKSRQRRDLSSVCGASSRYHLFILFIFCLLNITLTSLEITTIWVT